jgi:hypothetical protein
MRCGLFNGITCGDRFAGLLPATQAEMPRRRQPVGQDSVGLPAWMTDSAPHPDAFVSVIVALPKAPAVADDRVTLASRAPSWQKAQRDSVFRVKQCDKENHGWREARAERPLPKFGLLAGPSPSRQISFRTKKNTAFPIKTPRPTRHIGR